MLRQWSAAQYATHRDYGPACNPDTVHFTSPALSLLRLTYPRGEIARTTLISPRLMAFQ